MTNTKPTETRLQWDLAKDLLDEMKRALRNPPLGAHISSLPLLSKSLGGLRPNELTLLCAGTGTGKTALISTIAADLILAGTPVFAAPVETGGIDFLARVCSAAVGQELNTGVKVSDSILREFEEKKEAFMREAPLFIANYENRVSIPELLGVLEAMVYKGVKVALLDNLNFFLEISSADMERAVLDHAIHELVMFVKKYPIHIILICHPRKTEGGRVESEFDIKGSATAVQECANVILFNRPKKEDVDGITRTWSQRELVFKKIRKRGMYVNKPIWLDYANGRYTELENQSIDGPGSNRSNNGWRMPNAIKSSTKNHF